MRIIKMLLVTVIMALYAGSAMPSELKKEKVNYEIRGYITYETLVKFKADAELYDIETVSLNSGGGSLFSAISIGAIIHSKGMNTYVAKGSICASACGYIFLAGNKKLLLSKIGIHEFTLKEGPYHNLSNKAKVDATEVHWRIANYLGFIGINHQFIQDSMEIHSNNMKYIGVDQLNSYMLRGNLIMGSVK